MEQPSVVRLVEISPDQVETFHFDRISGDFRKFNGTSSELVIFFTKALNTFLSIANSFGITIPYTYLEMLRWLWLVQLDIVLTIGPVKQSIFIYLIKMNLIQLCTNFCNHNSKLSAVSFLRKYFVKLENQFTTNW